MTANTNNPPITTKAGIRARMQFVDPRTKTVLAAALALVEETAARAARRAFMQRGWARALLHEAGDDLQAHAIKLRGTTFAIAVTEVQDDEWAAQYQRVAFRRARVRRAFGQDGLRGRSVFGEGGFVRVPQAIIDDENTETMQKLRLRARDAKARAADKRHPREAILDAMNAKAIEEEYAGGY